MPVMFGFGDLVKMTTASTGVSAIALGAAVPSFLSFAEAGIVDGDIVSYAIEDGGDREVGRGIYSAGMLTREVYKSTNDDDPIVLSGDAQVSIVASAEDLRGINIPVDGGGFTTGDIKLSTKSVPDYGWLMMNDGTFGNESSGANTAHEICKDLFALFFRNMRDADVPLLTSAGGATTRASFPSAEAAWNARCRMSLPKLSSRTLAVAGDGDGLTARSLGGWQGSESRTLEAPSNPSHGHNFVGWAAMLSNQYNGTWGVDAYGWNASGSDLTEDVGGTPWSVMNPTTYFNVMVKL